MAGMHAAIREEEGNRAMADLSGKRIVVVGGRSGIGAAIACAAVEAGAAVIVGSSSKPQDTVEPAQSGIRLLPVDLADAASIADFVRQCGGVDHLAITAQSSTALRTLKPLSELDFTDLETAFQVKLFGTLRLVRAALPSLARDSSVLLVSGAASRRIIPGHVGLGALNGAIESAGRQLARELAPIRVNVLSPGLVRTEAYDPMPADQREAMYAARARALPVGRIGRPEDIAAAAMHLMQNGYVTGTVQDIDGGGLIAG